MGLKIEGNPEIDRNETICRIINYVSDSRITNNQLLSILMELEYTLECKEDTIYVESDEIVETDETIDLKFIKQNRPEFVQTVIDNFKNIDFNNSKWLEDMAILEQKMRDEMPKTDYEKPLFEHGIKIAKEMGISQISLAIRMFRDMFFRRCPKELLEFNSSDLINWCWENGFGVFVGSPIKDFSDSNYLETKLSEEYYLMQINDKVDKHGNTVFILINK